MTTTTNDKALRATFDQMYRQFMANTQPYDRSDDRAYIAIAKSGKFTKPFMDYMVGVSDRRGSELWAAAHGGPQPRLW